MHVAQHIARGFESEVDKHRAKDEARAKERREALLQRERAAQIQKLESLKHELAQLYAHPLLNAAGNSDVRTRAVAVQREMAHVFLKLLIRLTRRPKYGDRSAWG